MSSLLEYKLDLIAEALGAYKVETVASVIRRSFTRSDGEDVEVVDFYPAWNAVGTYGKMKVATEYMDHDWQRERFEKFSGLVYADLPVFEAKQADMRVYGRTGKYEMAVRPFQLMLKPQPVADGPDGKTLILRYLAAPANGRAAQPGTQPAPATGAKIFGYTYGDGTQVNGNPTERATFDEYRRANNEQAPASVEALREWFKNRK
jgi:hypothetical protein